MIVHKKSLFICFILGFTALTEKYSNMATSDGTSGTDKLSATLNAYIGKIVDGTFQLTIECLSIGPNQQSIFFEFYESRPSSTVIILRNQSI